MSDAARAGAGTRCAGALPPILTALLVGGCSTVGYYARTVRGGLALMQGRRPVERVIADPATPPELRERLSAASEMRRFAVEELGLADNGSYRRYKALDRRFAVWNVVAAPELSVEPVRWCFPVAGCVSYRGYFSPGRAERFAARLRRRGLETDVGGVAAFSTLGWFKDPLLSTFIGRDEGGLAGLMFHELAHQRLYVRGDTPFNESFAAVVELEGVRRWFEARGENEAAAAYRTAARRERQLAELVQRYRRRLAAVYEGAEPADRKRAEKRRLFAALRADYERLKLAWDGWTGYDGWFDEGLNNARLASLGVYAERVPAFEHLLARSGSDLETFYREVERLAKLPPAERHAALDELAGAVE